MKILILDGMPFMYPEDISNMDDFIDYANENFYRFIPMNELSLENCVYPYFVEDDIKVRYINMSLVKSIFEDEVELLSRYEYDERLKDLQSEICINCKNYYDDPDGDNLDGHRDEMRLDGFCPNFEPINGDDLDDDDGSEFQF
jgi:hypothetical protein